jgi:hypothetical protein
LVFVASPLSMQHEGERVKTGWLEIRIMCPEWDAMSIHRLVKMTVTSIGKQKRYKKIQELKQESI